MKINVIVVFRSIGLKKFHGCNTTRGVWGSQFVATFTIIPVNVVEQTDEEDSESERESEMSSSECEMSEYEIEYVTV